MRQKGQSLVEVAIILPIFLIMLFGVLETGWAIRNYVNQPPAKARGLYP